MLTKKSQRSKGFTLVELLVTIAILAVLATVSVVGYISFIEKSAVSTDNYLVTQLNDLARLYEIEHTGSFEESDVRKLVKNAGITSLELKSESYDYRLYFNQNNNKFILTTEDYSNDEKYLLIDDGFLSKNDGDDVGENNKNQENVPEPDGEGEVDDSIETKPHVISFFLNEEYSGCQTVKNGQKKYNLNSYYSGNSINVENVILYNEETSAYFAEYYLLAYNDIIKSFDENSNEVPIDDVICTPISLVKYLGYDPSNQYFIDKESETISFYLPGTYSLTFIVEDTYAFTIYVNVFNMGIKDNASLTPVNKSNIYTPQFVNNDDESKIVGIRIFYHFTCVDVNLITQEKVYFDYSSLNREEMKDLVENGRIEVQINDDLVEIQEFEDNYCVILHDIYKGDYAFEITVSYIGTNGHKVSFTQQVKLHITEYSIQITSIKSI